MEHNQLRSALAGYQRTLLILIGLSLLIGGCQPGITTSPISTPQVITVQVTSSLLPLQPIFKTCVETQENSALIIDELSTPSLIGAGDHPALRWGADPSSTGFAAVIGQETLVVVVHPRNPLGQISQANLQAIYAGTLKKWPKSGPGAAPQPWIYPAGEDIQSIFVNTILNGAQPARSGTSIAPDPQAVLDAVAANQGAVGFLPRRWLSSQVKEITVAGIPPTNLRQPILALTKSEPKSKIKEWLLCLQDRLVE
jgi:hypothetical protein